MISLLRQRRTVFNRPTPRVHATPDERAEVFLCRARASYHCVTIFIVPSTAKMPPLPLSTNWRMLLKTRLDRIIAVPPVRYNVKRLQNTRKRRCSVKKNTLCRQYRNDVTFGAVVRIGGGGEWFVEGLSIT